MKKKMALIVLMSSVIGMSFTGCEKEDTTSTQSTEAVETNAGDTSEATGNTSNSINTDELDTEGSLRALTLEDYVTIGDYKGVEVSVPKVVITEEEIDSAINDYLTYYCAEEILEEEGTVENGDTVRIDYVGYMDGEAFEGGTGSTDLMIGSGSFIPGFEESLVGSTVGETVTIDVAFPDPYENNPDFSGKPAQFDVTIHAKVSQSVPELSEEVVPQIAEAMNVEATDMESLRKAVYDTLFETKDGASKDNIGMEVQKIVYANMTVKDTPEFLKNRLYIRMDSNYNYYGYMYGVDGPTFLSYMNGIEPAAYTDYVMTEAADYANQYIGYQQIAEIEGIDVTDEEAMAEMESLYEEYGYESVDDFLQYVSLEEYRDDLMFEKVLQFLIDNAKVTYSEAEAETTEETVAE